MHSTEIRRRYLQFFAERGHAILPSASLVPENDPTVLFTTAGMHPLVPFLLGETHPQGKRLASVQKCLRTQDIEEVGDNRHDTFFEMLGNWSLGDYFKKEAISWSWQFITDSEKGLGLDPKRLYITVFSGDNDAPGDEESIQLWQEQFALAGIEAGIDKSLDQGGRIFRLTKESNWWPPVQLNPGPCGPDTEMFYDLGEENGALTLSDGLPDFDSGRLLEFWNDVFMQYRKNEYGNYEPLIQHNVDTGMGLERVALITQQVKTIFDTDLFAPIMQALQQTVEVTDPTSLRIMADHLRSGVMLINDGVRPSNKERGYVLRRLLRRAILHSQQENTDWLPVVINTVIDIYKESYPEVAARQAEILEVISEEAQKFQKTLNQGKKEIAKLDHITGKEAFNLYQSYGFPWELTKEYAQSRGIQLEEAEFEAEFELHKNLSRTAAIGQFKSGLADHSQETVRYHTATHLLHQALREVLGEGVQQRGSNITAERLRFDFSYPEKVTAEQLREVEEKVNGAIQSGLAVSVASMSPEQAKQEGAIGLFGHKYGDSVSVYSIGNYSKEICTGPHVENTGELGQFEIIKEEAVSSGVRRIKAVLH